VSAIGGSASGGRGNKKFKTKKAKCKIVNQNSKLKSGDS
jgi:hypothetical protein